MFEQIVTWFTCRKSSNKNRALVRRYELAENGDEFGVQEWIDYSVTWHRLDELDAKIGDTFTHTALRL